MENGLTVPGVFLQTPIILDIWDSNLMPKHVVNVTDSIGPTAITKFVRGA